MLKKYYPVLQPQQGANPYIEMVEDTLGSWIPADIGQEMYDIIEDFVAFGEKRGWDQAMSGRQQFMKDARRILAEGAE